MTRPIKAPTRIVQTLLDAAPLRKSERPGRLDTLDDLQKEWGRIHRLYWRGKLAREEFSAGLYSLQTGSSITKMRDELAHAKEELARLADLREQLARLRGAPALDYLPAETGDASLVAVTDATKEEQTREQS